MRHDRTDEPAEPGSTSPPDDTRASPDVLDRPDVDLEGIHRWMGDRGSTDDDLTPRYRLGLPLGRGGMGQVREARDRRLLRTVALKSVRKALPTANEVQAFLQEAQVTGQLEHPNIPAVHDVGLGPDGVVFFTMKRVNGRTLKELMATEDLPLVRRLGIFLKVCEAVAYAHAAGVLHRDLKPVNIMVGAFGQVYVMDWGLARLVHDDRVEVTEERTEESGSDSVVPAGAGTPGYIPPEQARGDLAMVDERTDVYGLGAILNFLLTGDRAFEGRGPTLLNNQLMGRIVPPRARDRRVPWELDAVVVRALQVDPDRRFPSVDALREEVERYLGGVPLRTVHYSPTARLQKWAVRHRAVVLPVGTTLFLAAMVVVGVLVANGVRLAGARDRALEAEQRAAVRLADSQVALARVLAETGRRVEARALLEEAHQRYLSLDRSPLRARLAASVLELSFPPPPVRVSGFGDAGVLAAIDDDGETVFVGEAEGTGLLLSAADGEVRARYDLPRGASHGWLVDGHPLVLVGPDDRWVELWDLSRDEVLLRARGLARLPLGACLLDGGRMLAVGDNQGTSTWALADGSLVHELPHYRLLGCAHDATRIMVDGPHRSERHRSVSEHRVVDVATGHTVYEAGPGAMGLLSRDGGSYFHLPDVHHVQQIDLGTGAVGWTTPTARSPRLSLLGGPRPQLVVVGSIDNEVQVLDALDGQLRASRRLLGGPPISHGSILASPRGRHLVTVRQDGLAVWSVPRTGDDPHRFEVGADVNALAVSPDGALVATADWAGRVALWDWRTGTRLEVFETSPEGAREVAFSADGRRLGSADRDGGVRVIDLVEGRVIRTMHGPEGLIAMGVYLYEDGRLLAGYEDGSLRLFTPDGAHRDLRGGLRSLWALCPSPDGRLLVATGRLSHDPSAEVWDLERLEPVMLSDRTSNAFRAAFHPDGERFAVADGSGHSAIFAVTRATEIAILGRQEEKVQSTAFSPDGRLLALGLYDGSIQIHETGEWQEVLALPQHLSRSVIDLEFIPNTHILVAAAGSGQVAVLDLEAERVYLDARVEHRLGAPSPEVPPPAARARAATLRGDWETAARLWDQASGQVGLERVRAQLGEGDVSAARATLDGVSGLSSGSLAVWRRGLAARADVLGKVRRAP